MIRTIMTNGAEMRIINIRTKDIIKQRRMSLWTYGIRNDEIKNRMKVENDAPEYIVEEKLA